MPDQIPQPQPPGDTSELATFGEDLRKEREIRGISLKEIADATKISRRFLDAIERNDHKTLPAPVFTRGFVREYARYLGLNAEEMVNRYNFAAANDDRIEKPPTIEKYPQTPPKDIAPKPPRKRGIPPVYTRVDANVLLLLAIAAALGAVIWWAVRYNRMPRENALDTPVAAATAPPAVAPAPTPAPPQPSATDESTLRLTIEVVDNSWVTLDADGESVINTELTAGERREVEANDSFRFRTIGNAAGLNLTFNGTPVPPLGDTGEVIRNRVFDREMLQQIRAANPQNARTRS